MYKLGPLLLVTASAVLSLASGESLRLIGTITVSHPGHLNLYVHPDAADAESTYSVLVSTWETGDPYDEAFVLIYPGRSVDTNFTDVRQSLISNILHHPKEIIQVPEGIFPFPAVSTADGKIVDGVTMGTIYITDVSDINFPATEDILDPITDEHYAYSDMIWMQVDAGPDGYLWDVMTCRVELDGETIIAAQLVWLEQPTIDYHARWDVGILKESACDSYMTMGPLLAGTRTYDVIFTTGSFTRKLAFFWTTDQYGRWNDAADIVGEILDYGRMYADVELVDLNNDGKLDVVATVAANQNGSVEVWEIPADFRNTDEYVHRVIATGFTARSDSSGISPGLIKPFYPTNGESGKPYLLLAGVDSGQAYYLQPVSEMTTDWSYDVVTITDQGPGERVSGIVAADIDGDGYKEIFVSTHDKHLVEIFTFAP